MKFSLFTGLPEQFNLFLKNAETIFQLYPSAEQRILKLAKLVSDDIKQHILCYLSSGDSAPTQAIENMKAKFWMKKLIKPVL